MGEVKVTGDAAAMIGAEADAPETEEFSTEPAEDAGTPGLL